MRKQLNIVKDSMYFARWTSIALELALSLTEDSVLLRIEKAVEAYFDRTYIPDLTTQGRLDYELKKAFVEIQNNLTALQTILEISDSSLTNMLSNLYVNCDVKRPNTDVLSDAKKVKLELGNQFVLLMQGIKEEAFTRYVHDCIDTFITKQNLLIEEAEEDEESNG